VVRRHAVAAVALLFAAASGSGAAQDAASACDPAPGKKLFEQCLSCHSLDASGKSVNAGPNLNGVIGRKAGTLPGYGFSAALKGSGITWTEADLDAFITRPAKKVPGTVMMFVGMRSAADRAALLCYLRSAAAPAAAAPAG
jgi:cytochrome c